MHCPLVLLPVEVRPSQVLTWPLVISGLAAKMYFRGDVVCSDRVKDGRVLRAGNGGTLRASLGLVECIKLARGGSARVIQGSLAAAGGQCGAAIVSAWAWAILVRS